MSGGEFPVDLPAQRVEGELPSGLRDRPVYVSTHAKERLFQRCPELRGSGRNFHSLAVSEVHEALAAGRFGKNPPKWLNVHESRKRTSLRERAPGRGTMRCAWNAEKTRCYVLRLVGDRRPGREREKAWLVVTIYQRPPRSG